jgi:hypothetical protein
MHPLAIGVALAYLCYMLGSLVGSIDFGQTSGVGRFALLGVRYGLLLNLPLGVFAYVAAARLSKSKGSLPVASAAGLFAPSLVLFVWQSNWLLGPENLTSRSAWGVAATLAILRGVLAIPLAIGWLAASKAWSARSAA